MYDRHIYTPEICSTLSMNFKNFNDATNNIRTMRITMLIISLFVCINLSAQNRYFVLEDKTGISFWELDAATAKDWKKGKEVTKKEFDKIQDSFSIDTLNEPLEQSKKTDRLIKNLFKREKEN